MIRTGVEFHTNQISNNLAKGVNIEDLNILIKKTFMEKTSAILYYILGIESETEIIEYYKKIASDYKTLPKINVVGTYIDPQPCTPMYDFNISKKHEIDFKKIYQVVIERNKRFNLKAANIKRSTWRTLMQRVTSIEQFLRLNKKSYSHDELINEAYKIDNRLVGTADLSTIMDRSRNDNYIGQTAIPYWQ